MHSLRNKLGMIWKDPRSRLTILTQSSARLFRSKSEHSEPLSSLLTFCLRDDQHYFKLFEMLLLLLLLLVTVSDNFHYGLLEFEIWLWNPTKVFALIINKHSFSLWQKFTNGLNTWGKTWVMSDFYTVSFISVFFRVKR